MTSRRSIRIGTRGSRLARWQTEQIRARLAAAGHATEIVEIAAEGDRDPDVPLSRVRDPHFFTGALDRALARGTIDAAVHSLKDVATTMAPGVAVAAIPGRADPADALVGRGRITLADLPPGARVGTCSLRRRAQLLRARPDLTVVDLRGNVDGRVAALDRNVSLDAIVLAVAGLARLGLAERIGERFPIDLMVPAPGQGALAVSVREGDAPVAAAVREAIHDLEVGLLTAAERTVLTELDCGCHLPVAALAQHDPAAGPSGIRLVGRVLSLDGRRSVDAASSASVGRIADAIALGSAVVAELRRAGADRLLAEAERELAAPAPGILG